MNQNRLKVTIIVLVMFFINGCFSHVGTQKNNFLMTKVSTEDKKLLSSYNDEVLYIHNYNTRIENTKASVESTIGMEQYNSPAGKVTQYTSNAIRITKNGFYPNCKLLETTLTSELKKSTRYCSKTKYMKQSLGGLLTKFNMNKFMHDINEANLKELRLNIIAIKKRFPSVNLQRLPEKAIKTLHNLLNYSQANNFTDFIKETERGVCPKIGGYWNDKKNQCKMP
ncbi:MAG: Unknown protein [uncultured Sulfurovum sp.]|uniref:Uncharacterized protein n=1 Tax=uncultured Sulfurovum sp. TaxID=269237 RepID=A0A6S6SD71_9BACT|nr:MAG: Unknown protein [uncultured Sulfurovum sp.]